MLTNWHQILGQNLAACHRCPLRQENCRGACACRRAGRDIIALAEEGACPIGKHSVPPSRGLGDTVAKLAKAIGADRAVRALTLARGVDCGCGRRRRLLNDALPYRQT